MRWHHRPALDGLRTLAVYGVLLYHCGLQVATGGFVGVDLFFVLSGFLVTSVLLNEFHRTGTLHVTSFYARRVRRLLPAGVVVILATSALFAVLASTAARVPWINDARSALLYVANWRFIASENDYFGADVSQSPFLHFWSLAIEEQFYLVLPLLLLGLLRLRKRWAPALVTGLAVLFVASVAAQLYWAAVNPTHAYYGTDARIYQMLLGSMAALMWRDQVMVHVGEDPQREGGIVTGADRARGAVTWVVLALLVLSGSSLLEVSPSNRGLIAAALSVLLIWALTDQWSDSLTRVLSWTPIVYLGQISYGTYLWHWPIVLALKKVLGVEPWVLAIIVAMSATGMAALSHHILETPIRRRSWLDAVPRPTIAAGLTASIVMAVGLAPWLLEIEGKPQLVAAAQPVVVAAAHAQPVPSGIAWSEFRDDIGVKTEMCTPADQSTCIVHRGSGQTVMLVGDSHARQLAAALRKLAAEHDFTLALSATGGCSWQMGLAAITERGAEKGCPQQRTDLYDSVLTDMGVDVVVLAQRDRNEGPTWHGRVTAPGVEGGVDEVNRVTIERTLDRLAELDIPTIIVESLLRPGAQGIEDPLECLASATDAAQCQLKAPEQPPLADAFYRAQAARHATQETVNLNSTLCSAWPICGALEGDVPVWRDGGHPTSAILVKRREQIWQVLAGTGLLNAG